MAVDLRSEFEFPGVEGTLLPVTTNMFRLEINESNIIKKVNVVATMKTKEGNIVAVEGNKVFSLFKKAYGGLFKKLGIVHVIEGYPTKDGITVYVITTKKLFFKKERVGYNEVIAQFCGSIAINDWNTVDNDLKMFLKKVFVTTLFEMFDKHQYTLLKRVIYSFKTEGNFPAVFLNSVFQLLPGIRVGYETDIPDDKDSLKSKNLVSINYSATVATRVNVGLLQCYEEMCAEVIATLTNGNRRGIEVHAQPDQKLPPICVDLLNDVLEKLEVYIPYETVKNCHVYYKIDKILPKSAHSYRSRDKSGSLVPVTTHYERLHKLKIRYPGMNAVALKRKNKTFTVPLELVVLADKPQRVSASASYILTHLTERIKELAALVPGKRWEFIRGAAGKFHADLMDTNKQNLLKEIGLEFDDDPITVKGSRVLDTPVDTYSEAPGTLAIPYRNPVEYVLVDFHRRRDASDDVKGNVDNLMDKMRDKFGISIAHNKPLNVFNFNWNSKNSSDENTLGDLDTVVRWHTTNKPKKSDRKLLYVAVIDDNHKFTKLHGLIKQKLEANGMISQVITVGVLKKTHSSYRPDATKPAEDYSFNVALNINAKLGGINCVPSKASNKLWDEYINDKNPTMFIGIDTRLGKEKSKQSVVAILTSMDTTGTRYNQSFIMSRDGRYTADFTEPLKDALDSFKDSKGNSIVPKDFMIFRAGMNEYELSAKTGEGAFEFKKIEGFINSYMKSKRINIVPKITYIGYNRSHNFRCYNPKDENLIKNDEDGVKLNVPEGTVIDSTVTSKNCFYLVSHETFLGTTKPPKYRVVEGMSTVDGNAVGNYKADNLLAIIYQLCRLNPQSKRSFRRPVPIGLASKLLERIVEKCPGIFDGKPDAVKSVLSHPDFKGISYFI